MRLLLQWPGRSAGLGLALAAGTSRLRLSTMCEPQSPDLKPAALLKPTALPLSTLPALHEAIAPLGRQYQTGELWRGASGLLRLALEWSETDLSAPTAASRQISFFELSPDVFSGGSAPVGGVDERLRASATIPLDPSLRQTARRDDLEFRLCATGANGKPRTLTAEMWDAGALLARRPLSLAEAAAAPMSKGVFGEPVFSPSGDAVAFVVERAPPKAKKSTFCFAKKSTFCFGDAVAFVVERGPLQRPQPCCCSARFALFVSPDLFFSIRQAVAESPSYWPKGAGVRAEGGGVKAEGEATNAAVESGAAQTVVESKALRYTSRSDLARPFVGAHVTRNLFSSFTKAEYYVRPQIVYLILVSSTQAGARRGTVRRELSCARLEMAPRCKGEEWRQKWRREGGWRGAPTGGCARDPFSPYVAHPFFSHISEFDSIFSAGSERAAGSSVGDRSLFVIDGRQGLPASTFTGAETWWVPRTLPPTTHPTPPPTPPPLTPTP